MVLILVEGPDCVGKSGLVERLAATLRSRNFQKDQVTILHRGRPTEHPLDEYELPLVTYRPGAQTTHVICDRWHIGEVVYPPIMQRETQLTPGVLRHIELFLVSRGALVVSVNADTDVIADCIAGRGDDHVTPAHAEALRSGFINATLDSILPVYSVDSHGVSDTETIWWIIQEALFQEQRMAFMRDVVTYVGPRYPDLLLLGDTRNVNDRVTNLNPAFMPYPNTSGAYLFDVLCGDQKPISFGIMNACDVDNAHTVWANLGTPTTIALGRRAQAFASDWIVDHAPHPQWWRRFRHHDQKEYRSLLLNHSRFA